MPRFSAASACSRCCAADGDVECWILDFEWKRESPGAFGTLLSHFLKNLKLNTSNSHTLPLEGQSQGGARLWVSAPRPRLGHSSGKRNETKQRNSERNIQPWEPARFVRSRRSTCSIRTAGQNNDSDSGSGTLGFGIEGLPGLAIPCPKPSLCPSSFSHSGRQSHPKPRSAFKTSPDLFIFDLRPLTSDL